MKKPIVQPLALLATLALLGACADSDPPAGSRDGAQTSASPSPGESTPEPTAQGDDAPDADPTDADLPDDTASSEAPEAQAPPASVRGTVDVAGVTYAITEVRRCEPLEMDMVDRVLELQGLGEHEGQRVQIDVYVQEIAGQQHDEVSWAGPEGVFGTPDGTRVTQAGSTVSGSATMFDSLTHEQTLSMSFELEVPDEIISCR